MKKENLNIRVDTKNSTDIRFFGDITIFEDEVGEFRYLTAQAELKNAIAESDNVYKYICQSGEILFIYLPTLDIIDLLNHF